jgi:hypothetical protein
LNVKKVKPPEIAEDVDETDEATSRKQQNEFISSKSKDT